jgi:hypothetical protein
MSETTSKYQRVAKGREHGFFLHKILRSIVAHSSHSLSVYVLQPLQKRWYAPAHHDVPLGINRALYQTDCFSNTRGWLVL